MNVRVALTDLLMDTLAVEFVGRIGSSDSREPDPAQVVGSAFVWLYQIDGSNDLIDHASTFDLHVISDLDYGVVEKLALDIEGWLLGYPVRVSSGGRSVVIDRVNADRATVEIPWEADRRVTRFAGTYTLVSRARQSRS